MDTLCTSVSRMAVSDDSPALDADELEELYTEFINSKPIGYKYRPVAEYGASSGDESTPAATFAGFCIPTLIRRIHTTTDEQSRMIYFFNENLDATAANIKKAEYCCRHLGISKKYGIEFAIFGSKMNDLNIYEALLHCVDKYFGRLPHWYDKLPRCGVCDTPDEFDIFVTDCVDDGFKINYSTASIATENTMDRIVEMLDLHPSIPFHIRNIDDQVAVRHLIGDYWGMFCKLLDEHTDTEWMDAVMLM